MRLRRPSNWRPRKRFMASRDLGKQYVGQETTAGTIMIASGPYERKRFKTQAQAQAWLDEWDGLPEWGTVYELEWRAVS